MVRGGVLVTPRDRAMLAWIGRHGIVTCECREPHPTAMNWTFMGLQEIGPSRTLCK
jgi:hypothetical protein